MKTKILSSLFLVLVGASAHADYLYWMVDQPQESGFAFDYATIRAADSSSYLCLADVQTGETLSQSMVLGENAPSSTSYSTGAVYTDLAGYGQGSSFIVELWLGWGGSAKAIAIENLDWEQVRQNTYRALATIGSGDPFVARAFVPSPEPTSGVLFLLGAAVLCLRRKRGVK